MIATANREDDRWFSLPMMAGLTSFKANITSNPASQTLKVVWKMVVVMIRNIMFIFCPQLDHTLHPSRMRFVPSESLSLVNTTYYHNMAHTIPSLRKGREEQCHSRMNEDCTSVHPIECSLLLRLSITYSYSSLFVNGGLWVWSQGLCGVHLSINSQQGRRMTS